MGSSFGKAAGSTLGGHSLGGGLAANAATPTFGSKLMSGLDNYNKTTSLLGSDQMASGANPDQLSELVQLLIQQRRR